MITYQITKYHLSSIVPKYIHFNYPIEIAIAVRYDLPELIPILNKGLATFAEDEINAPSEKNASVQLSPEEKAWQAENHTVKVRVLDIPPFIISPYDITEQKQLALERAELQKHWEQAQKIEAVGTLAGGIARRSQSERTRSTNFGL